MSSTYREISTEISEWWASTSDDTPLLSDDDFDEFDDDIIGMEITFVTYSDEDLSWSCADDEDDGDDYYYYDDDDSDAFEA